MAAGLLATDAMMYANRELPWHSLGNPIGEENLNNIGVVREAAGLDWRVIEATPMVEIAGQMYPMNVEVLDEYGATTSNKGYRAILRDDLEGPEALLHVAKGRYHIVQNDVVFDIAAAINAEDNSVKFETAGSLRGGRTVWALARLGDDPRLDGLGVERYLLVVTSHDGSSKIKVIPTDVRVVCCNTLALANEGEAAFEMKHTRNVGKRIEEAKQALAATYNTHDAMSDEIYRLMNTEVTKAKFEEIIEQVFNPKGFTEGKGYTQARNRKDEARFSYANPNNVDIRDTGWGIVNAVNDAEVWASSIRGQWTRQEQQMDRIVGNFQPLTQQARDLVLSI